MEIENVDIVEYFYGVYLLYCINPKYKGRVYIGYTVNPNRRIKQHNAGRKAGGAYKTSNRGPWVMVMIIHGFPNDISALRFEWAWQHPHNSRRLQHVTKKKAKEKVYDFTLRVLSEMLQVGPWNRLPLTVRWLNPEFSRPLLKPPPTHMPICQGAVISKKLESSKKSADGTAVTTANIELQLWECYCCGNLIEPSEQMKCLNPNCDLVGHIICLGKLFGGDRGDYVPIEGQCPKCSVECLWGDLVRKFRGCYNNIDMTIRMEVEDFECPELDN